MALVENFAAQGKLSSDGDGRFPHKTLIKRVSFYISDLSYNWGVLQFPSFISFDFSVIAS